MTPQEANQIIHNYMGNKREVDSFLYISLDALVPVWDKLGNIQFEFLSRNSSEGFIYQCVYKGSFLSLSHNSIQEAAAIVTAKAINETGEG